ncbi:response regulator transcription factor [Ferrovibrio sp.]|jgi:CheY-like chemotaxis protein|uniref:response regulator transcription factor n=1 Tax=Ferrovibrio sp. TaxID=1917215 RepID=UPI0035ADC3FA
MIPAERRADVRILYGDPALGTRRLYRQALVSAGYTHLREFETLDGFADLLHVAQPDLVFMDVEMPGGNAIALTNDLRHGRLGVNPYLPIILTTWEPQQSRVRQIIDAGADDLLVKPLSTRALLDRVEAVGLKRKPFVVTSDYIGPDRRRSEARGGSAIQLIHVPNPMRAKLAGEPLDPHSLQHEIMVANEEINRQRLRASAFRIAFVAEQIVPVYESGLSPDEGTLTMLGDLISSTEDIQRRVADTEFAHVGQISDRLLQAARQIAEQGVTFVYGPEWHKPLELLKTLGEAVLAFFNPDRDASALAGEVAEAIDRFRARKAAQNAGEIPS